MAFRIGSAKSVTQAGMGVAVGIGEEVGMAGMLAVGMTAVWVGITAAGTGCEVQEQSTKAVDAIANSFFIRFMATSLSPCWPCTHGKVNQLSDEIIDYTTSPSTNRCLTKSPLDTFPLLL